MSRCAKRDVHSQHGIKNMRGHQLCIIFFFFFSHEWLQHSDSPEEPTVCTHLSTVKWRQPRWEVTWRGVSFSGTVTTDHDLQGMWAPLLPLEQMLLISAVYLWGRTRGLHGHTSKSCHNSNSYPLKDIKAREKPSASVCLSSITKERWGICYQRM